MEIELLTVTEVFELAGGKVVIADEFFQDFDGQSIPEELDVVVILPSGERVAISRPWIHARRAFLVAKR